MVGRKINHLLFITNRIIIFSTAYLYDKKNLPQPVIFIYQ